MRELRRIAMVALLSLLCSACSVTRHLHEGEYLVQKVDIQTDKQTPKADRIQAETFEEYVRQTPNKHFLGTNFYVWVYNKAKPEKDNWWNRMKRRIGEQPVLLDMSLTEKSARNLKTYMDSRGYYDSEVEYSVDTTRKRNRAYVTYRVKQGEPYYIESLGYEFRDEGLEPVVLADTANSLISEGDRFDITLLDKERTRIARYLNDRGYFNFSVNNIIYRVDTMGGDHRAKVSMVVRRNVTGYDERGDAIMDNNRIYRIAEINLLPNYNPAIARSEQYRTLLDTTYYRGLNIVTDGKPNVRQKVLHEAIPLSVNTSMPTAR